MTTNALYYPYIHIRDVDWLKGSLLLYSQVRRMLPGGLAPADSHEIRPYTWIESKKTSLLYPANLASERSEITQGGLAKKLARDSKKPKFVAAYGFHEARKGLRHDDYGFQIHQQKLVPELKAVLRESGLAWKPGVPEPYDEYEEYVELHPSVGEVVMSTLAVACAEGEGLEIIGDRRSGQLHRFLVEKDAHALYDAWLQPKKSIPPPKKATGEELFEFIIAFECDLSGLTPEKLVDFHEDREPIRKLVAKLREHAQNIEPMDPGKEREEHFKDEASAVLKNWERDRANMSAFWGEFFGRSLLDTASKPGEKMLEKALEGAGVGSVSGAAAGVAGAGVTLAGTLLGAGAGLAIGLLVHSAKTYSSIRTREHGSPYRALTIMEDAGVVFRTNVKRRADSDLPLDVV